eukprot:gb/GFBE01015169.1/.p1 GENE.gb/GFBE01015169.1/~~gb/GFBE01015169.1/.p1  ORF type:complete len:159 (+),score=37.59 gb/GFBE01015169.1/:1-477(+)
MFAHLQVEEQVLSSGSESGPEQGRPETKRWQIGVYGLVFAAAVALYIVGIMPNKHEAQAPAAAFLQKPETSQEFEMPDSASASTTHAQQSQKELQAEDSGVVLSSIPQKLQSWYRKQAAMLKRQIQDKTTVTYLESPNHFVKEHVREFLQTYATNATD